MYRDNEKIIQHDSQKHIISEGGDNLSNQKWTNCEIEYYQFSCSDCTKALCLEIKHKMSVIKKLYNPVKTLNMNDDNEENCYGVSTDSIREWTDFFFITIGEKASTNIPLSKMCLFQKICNTDTSLWTNVLRFG